MIFCILAIVHRQKRTPTSLLFEKKKKRTPTAFMSMVHCNALNDNGKKEKFMQDNKAQLHKTCPI